jgi:hypothetical protein
MSQVLVTFGLLDFTILQPILTWHTFLNLRTVYFFNFPNFFSGRSQPRIIETTYTAVHLGMYICVCVCVYTYIYIYIYIYIHTHIHTYTHTHTTWQNLTYISALSVGSHPRGQLGVTGGVGAHL